MGKNKETFQGLSETFCNSAMALAPFFMCVLDCHGSVVFFNREAEKVTGYPLPDITGKDFIEYFITYDKKESFREFFFHGLSGKLSPDPYSCVLESRCGETHYMEWTGIREKQDNKNFLLLVGKDLSEVFSKVSGLLSQTFHEINNSTTFIIGNTPFLKEAWKDIQKIVDQHYSQESDLEVARLPYPFFKEDYPQVIEDIETGCKRIRNIVERFREIERIVHDQKK